MKILFWVLKLYNDRGYDAYKNEDVVLEILLLRAEATDNLEHPHMRKITC